MPEKSGPEKSGIDGAPCVGPATGDTNAADNASKKRKPRGCRFMIVSLRCASGRRGIREHDFDRRLRTFIILVSDASAGADRTHHLVCRLLLEKKKRISGSLGKLA